MMTLSSFLKIQGFILLSLISTVIAIPANAQSPTSYAIGQYANPPKEQYPNNLNKSKVLSLPGANGLEVSIIGRIEKGWDYLTLYDSQNKEIGKYSGEMNEQFTVKGASIRVDFNSDGRTTDKGFIVNISHRLPAMVFKDIKEKLLAASHLFLKLGTEKAYAKISKNVQALKDLQAKMQQIPETDAFSDQAAAELMVIAQTYKEVAAMNIEVMKAHQAQFEILKGLKQETQYQIDKIDNKKQSYEALLLQTETLLKNTDNYIEKQKMQLSLTGYKNIIPSLNLQKASWNKLALLQETLEPKLELHSNNIELFLHTLGIYGEIYHEFAQATSMRQKNEVLTLNKIIKLSPQLHQIIAEIINSEKYLRLWIETIEQTEL